jgi:hypothetical protein
VLPEAHRPKDDAELARSIADEIRFIEKHTPSGIHVNRAAKAADA